MNRAFGFVSSGGKKTEAAIKTATDAGGYINSGNLETKNVCCYWNNGCEDIRNREIKYRPIYMKI